jgi:hypothetical protein
MLFLNVSSRSHCVKISSATAGRFKLPRSEKWGDGLELDMECTIQVMPVVRRREDKTMNATYRIGNIGYTWPNLTMFVIPASAIGMLAK